MKSRLLLTIILSIFGLSSFAQPDHWKENRIGGPTEPSTISKETLQKTEGLSSLKYTFTDDGTVFCISDTFAVTSGASYSLSCDYLDNDPSGRINTRIYFFNQKTNIGTSSSQYLSRITSTNTVKQADWQTITTTGTTPAGAVIAFIAINMNPATSGWTGAATFLADNFTYTENGNPNNLIVNGGFEDWSPRFTDYSFAGLTPPTKGSIDYNTQEVLVQVPFGTDVTNLISTFSLPVGVSAKIGVTEQVSGITPNDYTNPIVYTLSEVDAQGVTTNQDWTVIVTFGAPKNILTFDFESLVPPVIGVVDAVAHTVALTVPFGTDVTALVPTITTSATTTIAPLSGVAQDFTSPVNYTVTAPDLSSQNWEVTVNIAPASSNKAIIYFNLEGLNPTVKGIVNPVEHTINLEVPAGTNVTALVPTITLSPFATVSPASGVAQNFTNPVNYTVTAQDGTQQIWVVSVTFAAAGQTTLFYEDFENLPENKIPSSWVLINNDGYTQAAGEERWQDSAWVVTTSSRTELAGTKVAMASSYCSNMPLDGHADDWMILPKITLGANSTLSWQALSTTSSGNYPDDYMVLIAPAVNGVTPTVSYFEAEGNILVTVAPESWSAFVGNPGEGLKSRSINLKNTSTASAPDGWFNRDVWIAFALITDRYTNPNTGIPNSTAGGSNLAVDNIKVVNNTLTSIKETRKNELNVSLFPNPTAGEFKLSVKAEKPDNAEIEIFDLAGKMVLHKTSPVKTGENQLEMNVSSLNEGIYIIKTRINGMVNVSKLILR